MKANVIYFVMFAGLPTLFPVTSRAQERPETRLEAVEQIAARRLEALESVVARLPRLSGIMDLRLQGTDAVGGSNGFDARRARLALAGSISPAFDYRLQVELLRSPRVLDAYLTWKVSPCLNLQLGQFKVPFSLENPLGPTALEMIDNAMVITRLVGYDDVSGIAANGRDIGIGVHGGFFKGRGFQTLSYSAGVFNGNGINALDNNRAKDFSAIARVNPIRALTLASSYYHGVLPPQAGERGRWRSAFSARYEKERLLVRGEYIFGETRGVDSDGFYAVAGYLLAPAWQVVARYDMFQADVDDAGSLRENYTVGVNYAPLKALRVMLNGSHRTGGNIDPAFHVAAQVQFSF
jgi:hypothetical protein